MKALKLLFFFKLENSFNLPCLPMIMATCQFSRQLSNCFASLPRNAKTCRQVPTNANTHEENFCRQFAIFVGISGCQGHATSAKILVNNLLQGWQVTMNENDEKHGQAADKTVGCIS